MPENPFSWMRSLLAQKLKQQDSQVERLQNLVDESNRIDRKRAEKAEHDLRQALIAIGKQEAELAQYKALYGEIHTPKRLQIEKKEKE